MPHDIAGIQHSATATRLRRPRYAAPACWLVLAMAAVSMVACQMDRSGAAQNSMPEAVIDALPTPAGAPAAMRVDSDSARAAADEWYLPVGDDCRLYVREIGVGDPVVVVHGGFGAEHSYLLDAVAGLEHRFHFIFYDQRGSLRSPCADSAISISAHVADLDRLRISLQLERMAIVAHSMGTFLAMSYLAEHPDAVGPMALLGPIIPRTPSSEDENDLYQEEQRNFVNWAEAQASRELAEEQLNQPDSLLSARERTHKWRIGYASGNIYRIARWRLLKGGHAFYNPAAGQAASRTMGNWDFTDELRNHTFAVTMLLGDHDLVGFGGRLHRRMVADIPELNLTILAEAGHNSWIDRPADVRRLLAQALVRQTP